MEPKHYFILWIVFWIGAFGSCNYHKHEETMQENTCMEKTGCTCSMIYKFECKSNMIRCAHR